MNAISAYIEEQFTEALQRSYENAGGDVDEAIIQIGAGYVAFMVQHPDFLKYHTNIMKSQMFQLQDLEKKSVKSYEISQYRSCLFEKTRLSAGGVSEGDPLHVEPCNGIE